MTLPRFHVDADLRVGARGTLDPQQTRQVRSVLRLHLGDTIIIFDGSGAEARASLLSLQQAGASFEIGEVAFPRREPWLNLTVGLALLRGDRFENAVQKLTELGARALVPLEAERCVVSYDSPAAWEKRAERCRRIAREAAEQSERVTLLEIQPPARLDAFLARDDVVALRERSDAPLLATIPLAQRMAIAVGPEGGWSPREARALERAARGCTSLGTLILRAETAAVTAAGTLIQRAWAARDMRDTGR